jgi:hypothetical protein
VSTHRKLGCVLRGTPMLPPTWGPRWSAGFASKRPHSTATSTPDISALRLHDQVGSRSQKRRSAADPPLDRPSVATTRTRANSELSLPNELSPALARSLDRSGLGLLAPLQLGFANRRTGRVRKRTLPKPCPTRNVLYETSPILTPTARRTPPPQHRSTGTDGRAARIRLRGAISNRTARSELRDNVADPGAYR